MWMRKRDEKMKNDKIRTFLKFWLYFTIFPMLQSRVFGFWYELSQGPYSTLTAVLHLNFLH